MVLILYKNTSPEALKTLEEIEKTLPEQMLEYISPQIAFFYRANYRYKQRTSQTNYAFVYSSCLYRLIEHNNWGWSLDVT
jgi:hypothetical protein